MQFDYAILGAPEAAEGDSLSLGRGRGEGDRDAQKPSLPDAIQKSRSRLNLGFCAPPDTRAPISTESFGAELGVNERTSSTYKPIYIGALNILKN